jgi:hypothetical protein
VRACGANESINLLSFFLEILDFFAQFRIVTKSDNTKNNAEQERRRTQGNFKLATGTGEET